jgi:archaeosine-15-forming tRNA-guanine transglycosylase
VNVLGSNPNNPSVEVGVGPESLEFVQPPKDLAVDVVLGQAAEVGAGEQSLRVVDERELGLLAIGLVAVRRP